MNDIVPAQTRATALTPKTYEQAVQFAQMIAKSSMVPPDYRGKPENILLALQLGAELGLAPLQAIQSIATINGKPAVYGDAALALVRASPLCEDVLETMAGEGEDRAAVCVAKRRGKAPVTGRFSVKEAKRAGLWGKAGPWQNYPRRMLQMRARSFALRDAFPDVLRGLIVAEEAQDYPTVDQRSTGREPIDVTPVDTKADLDAFAGIAPTESPAAPSPNAPPTPEAATRSEPVGDLLQEPAPPPLTRWKMPKDPSARDWQAFADFIDQHLSDGTSGKALRADNETALRRLRDSDPALYDSVQEKLSAGR